MSNIFPVNFYLRDLILSFLSFIDIKPLVFQNKKFFVEILFYLKSRNLVVIENDIYHLGTYDLLNFLKHFQNIRKIQMNCRQIDLICVIQKLSRQLRSIEFTDFEIENFFDPRFWEEFSPNCLHLQKIKFVILNHDNWIFKNYLLARNIAKSLINFLEDHKFLRKFSLAFNRHDEIGIINFSPEILILLVKVLDQTQNKIQKLSFENVDYGVYFQKLQIPLFCPFIKEIKFKNYFSGYIFKKVESENKKKNPNFSNIFLKDIFPNLENVSLIDFKKKTCLSKYIIERNYLFVLNHFKELKQVSLPLNYTDYLHVSMTQNLLNNQKLTILNLDYTNFDDIASQVLAFSPH